MRITVEITNPELDAMEDVIMCWNLCEKHNRTCNSEDERWKATQECKECEEINAKLRGKALHLWSKMVTAYLKTREDKKKQKNI